jgi:predicted anti-sigma-YlaC factor YlaD
VLTCRDVPDRASAYIDGELDRRTRLSMRLHLLVCSMCRAYLDQLHKTRRLLGAGRMPEPPPEVEERLVQAARKPPA